MEQFLASAGGAVPRKKWQKRTRELTPATPPEEPQTIADTSGRPSISSIRERLGSTSTLEGPPSLSNDGDDPASLRLQVRQLAAEKVRLQAAKRRAEEAVRSRDEELKTLLAAYDTAEEELRKARKSMARLESELAASRSYARRAIEMLSKAAGVPQGAQDENAPEDAATLSDNENQSVADQGELEPRIKTSPSVEPSSSTAVDEEPLNEFLRAWEEGESVAGESASEFDEDAEFGSLPPVRQSIKDHSSRRVRRRLPWAKSTTGDEDFEPKSDSKKGPAQVLVTIGDGGHISGQTNPRTRPTTASYFPWINKRN